MDVVAGTGSDVLMPYKNKEHKRENQLKRRFGLSQAEYDDMSEAQGHSCAICRRPERDSVNGVVKRMAVDHEHVTGRIRGLLCSSCNRGIGLFDDDPETIRSAARYIESFR
jgi:hypothetical protein